MQFEYYGKKYRIVFEYGTGVDRATRLVKTTLARLFYYTDGEWRMTGFGHAKCVHSDHFDKEKGRKLALSRALAQDNRDFRRIAWNAYHTRQGGLLQPTVGEKLAAAWVGLSRQVAEEAS